MVQKLPTITIGGGMPSASALLGTSFSNELIADINQNMGSTYIGQDFNEADQYFIKNIITPARQAVQTVRNAAIEAKLIDDYKYFSGPDDLYTIPPCMMLPLIEYGPVRNLIKQGRIDGFGIPIEHIPKVDPYGRLISNGTTEITQNSPVNDRGNIEYEIDYDFESDDPDLTVEQVEMIESMRHAVDMAIEEGYDPTDMGNFIA